MRKIPTLFVRDWKGDPKHVTQQIDPEAAWVFTDENARATRKYDGTCVMFDGERWWARREVKPGRTEPPGFLLIEEDGETGKRVGWEPIERSGYAKWHAAAAGGEEFEPGTYELCGPKVNGNPEELSDHHLISHADASVVDIRPAGYRDVREAVLDLAARSGAEGIVWHHPDGRMAKIKARDFHPD